MKGLKHWNERKQHPSTRISWRRKNARHSSFVDQHHGAQICPSRRLRFQKELHHNESKRNSLHAPHLLDTHLCGPGRWIRTTVSTISSTTIAEQHLPYPIRRETRKNGRVSFTEQNSTCHKHITSSQICWAERHTKWTLWTPRKRWAKLLSIIFENLTQEQGHFSITFRSSVIISLY